MIAKLMHNRYALVTVITLGLLAGGIIGWRQPWAIQAHIQDEGVCPEWDPAGQGSWPSAGSLPRLTRNSDLLIKAEAVGHDIKSDNHKIAGNEGSYSLGYLINEVKVLQVLKGNVSPGTTIQVSSLGGVCLKTGEIYYLMLSGHPKGYSEEFVDDPDKLQGLRNYSVHLFGQWRVRDGKVEHIPSLLSKEFTRFQGMPEDTFRGELRQAIESTPTPVQ